MNSPTYVVVLLACLLTFVVLATVFLVVSRPRKARKKNFETICSQWLDLLNCEVKKTQVEIGGSFPFSRNYGEKIREKLVGEAWVISYPLCRRYPNLGLQVKVEMILYVNSLIPDNQGVIATYFSGLTEPVKQWWTHAYHYGVFPDVADKLREKELTFTYFSALGNVLSFQERAS